MKSFQQLHEIYARLYQELEDDIENNDIEQEVYDLEQEVLEQMQQTDGREQLQLIALSKKIQKMKKEFDFYDEDAILDYMFPDRHDEDFDEDSMSYDSVFGDD